MPLEIEPKDLAYHLFDQLDQIRKTRGHAKKELAEYSNANRSSLWNNANRKNQPSLSRLISMAIALNCKIVLKGSRCKSWDISKSPSLICQSFVDYLEKTRVNKGYSIAYLCRKAGLPLSGWDKPKRGIVELSIRKFAQVSRVLGIELEIVEL